MLLFSDVVHKERTGKTFSSWMPQFFGGFPCVLTSRKTSNTAGCELSLGWLRVLLGGFGLPGSDRR